MKITSCDCFEEVGAEITPTNSDTFNMSFKDYVNYCTGATTGVRVQTIEDIKYCPYCGKKIEVEDE